MKRYPFSTDVGSGTTTSRLTSDMRKKSMMLNEVPAPRSMRMTSASMVRRRFRRRTFCWCLMFAAVNRSAAPLMRRRRGKFVSTATSSMCSTRRITKSASERCGAGTPRQVCRFAPPEVGVHQHHALPQPRQLPSEGRGEHGLADAALAAADRPHLPARSARDEGGERVAHRRVTLDRIASRRARVSFVFFHSGFGA